MSSALDTRSTAKDIINSVLNKMGTTSVDSIDQNSYSRVLLQLLNEVITDCDDYGDWEERYERVDATPVVGQDLYTFSTPDPIKRVHQIFYNDYRGPLKQVKKQEMNYLMLRTNTQGKPSFWSVWGVDTQNNPQIRIYPKPQSVASSDIFIMFYYAKTPNLTTDDGDYLPDFPANLLIRGLYYKALLEQNDGEQSAPIRAAMEEYMNAKREAHNRFTNDSGTSVRFVPAGGWLGRG